jgi:hypothetical protein
MGQIAESWILRPRLLNRINTPIVNEVVLFYGDIIIIAANPATSLININDNNTILLYNYSALSK